MKTHSEDRKEERILALDIRAYQIGYVGVAIPNRLLAFGVARFTSRLVGLARLTVIMRRIHPTALVLRKISARSARNTAGAKVLLRSAWLAAHRSALAVSMIRDRQVRDHFGTLGVTTKYQVALFLTKQFPELEWKLPPPRKAWKREHPNMSIFDAAALAMTYLAPGSLR